MSERPGHCAFSPHPQQQWNDTNPNCMSRRVGPASAWALCLWEYDGKNQPRLGFLKACEKLGTHLPSGFNKNEAPYTSVVRNTELMPIPRSSLRAEASARLAGSPRISHGKTLAVRPSVTARNPHTLLFYVMLLEVFSIQAQYLSYNPQTKRKEPLDCNEMWTKLERNDVSWMKEKDHGDGEQMERKGRAPTSQLMVQVLKHYQLKEKPGSTTFHQSSPAETWFQASLSNNSRLSACLNRYKLFLY